MSDQQTVTKNRTQALIAKLKQKRYDPLEELIAIAQRPDTPDKDKREIALALMPYCYPKLKHVEVDAQVNHGITVQVRQFIKPSNVISMENHDDKIPGHGQPIGKPEPRKQLGSSEGDILTQAALPVGAGGHPDIIPDPEIPTKRKTV